MRVHVFETPRDQAAGLQFMDRVDPDTLYVFPSVTHESVFHSRNVPEPFDIAFLDANYLVLALVLMRPPRSLVRAPMGCAMAVEARAGNLRRWGFVPGHIMSPVESGP